MEDQFESDESRGRERDLDSLVGMELASGSPAAALIWKAARRKHPSAVQVRFQAKRRDHRTTDVHATAGGITLLIENKVPGGHYEPGQAESYGAERRASIVLALTIGPRAFETSFRQKQECFDAFVAIEDLAEELRDAANAVGPELRAGYLHRAHRYDLLATPVVKDPLPDVVAFGDLYRRLAEERTQGRVRLTEGSFRRGPRAIFAPGHPVPAPFQAMHKLRHSVLDVLFIGWTLTQLEEFWSTIDEARRPHGWVVATQSQGKATKETGEPTPVLRRVVDPVHEVSADGFAAGQLAISDAIDALDEIGPWLEAHVPKGSLATDAWLLDRHLERAAQIAERHDSDRAKAIRGLIAVETVA